MKKSLFYLLAVAALMCAAENLWAQNSDGVTINGVIWATRNVSATPGEFVSQPEDHGGYYTFDEAQTACPEGWRTPSKEEFVSLAAAPSEWTAFKSVNGRIFGSGNNTIFLPASGYRNNSSGALSTVSSFGYYWSALPYNTSNGYSLSFYSSSVYPVRGYDRSFGFSVRCVSE